MQSGGGAAGVGNAFCLLPRVGSVVFLHAVGVMLPREVGGKAKGS